MEETTQLLSGWVGVFIAIFGFVWVMLSFLAPFFWYGTNKRAKEISEKMDVIIDLEMKKQMNPPPGAKPPTQKPVDPDAPRVAGNVRDSWIRG